MNRSNRSNIAGRRRHVRFNLTETRKEQLTRSLVNKGMLIDYARNPFRTIVRTALQPQYTMAVLGDSIAYGMFIRDAVVISCPGATLARMAVPEIREYIKSCGVKRLAILGGTNDLVARDGTVTPVEPILERLKSLIEAFKDEGIRVAVMQVPGRRRYKTEIKMLNKALKSCAKKNGAVFQEYTKFTYVGVCGDGIHPSPAHLQDLTKEVFRGLEKLC